MIRQDYLILLRVSYLNYSLKVIGQQRNEVTIVDSPTQVCLEYIIIISSQQHLQYRSNFYLTQKILLNQQEFSMQVTGHDEGWVVEFLACLLRVCSLKALLTKIHNHNSLAYARNPSAVNRITYDLKNNIQSRRKN